MYIFGGITDTSVYLNDLLEYNYGIHCCPSFNLHLYVHNFFILFV